MSPPADGNGRLEAIQARFDGLADVLPPPVKSVIGQLLAKAESASPDTVSKILAKVGPILDQARASVKQQVNDKIEEVKHDASDRVLSTAGVASGVVLEGANLIDSVTGGLAALKKLQEKGLEFAKQKGLISETTKQVLLRVDNVPPGIEGTNLAKAAGEKMDGWEHSLEGKLDPSTKGAEDSFTEYEKGQLTGSLGSQVGLAFVGAEEVQVALKAAGLLGGVKQVMDLIEKKQSNLANDVELVTVVIGMALTLVGLKEGAAGHKVVKIIIASNAFVAVVPKLTNLYDVYKDPSLASDPEKHHKAVNEAFKGVLMAAKDVVLSVVGSKKGKASEPGKESADVHPPGSPKTAEPSSQAHGSEHPAEAAATVQEPVGRPTPEPAGSAAVSETPVSASEAPATSTPAPAAESAPASAPGSPPAGAKETAPRSEPPKSPATPRAKAPGKGQVTAANVNQVAGMQTFLTELENKGLTLNDLNVTPEKVIQRLNEDPVAGMEDLNQRLDIAIESRQQATESRGPNSFVEGPGEGDRPPYRGRGSKQMSKDYAHDLGVQLGKEQALADGLTWHFDNPRGTERTTPGLDNIFKDGGGNLVVVEFKGGQAGLKPAQMTNEWVNRELKLLEKKMPGSPIVKQLRDALQEGRLKGRTYLTEIDSVGRPLPTKVVDHGTYSAI